jgi:hypothetical protein
MIYYPSVLGAGQLTPHGSVDCKRTQTSSHCLCSTSTVTSPPLSILCLRTQFGQRSNLGVGTNQPPREHLRIHSPTPLLLALVRVFFVKHCSPPGTVPYNNEFCHFLSTGASLRRRPPRTSTKTKLPALSFNHRAAADERWNSSSPMTTVKRLFNTKSLCLAVESMIRTTNAHLLTDTVLSTFSTKMSLFPKGRGIKIGS